MTTQIELLQARIEELERENARLLDDLYEAEYGPKPRPFTPEEWKAFNLQLIKIQANDLGLKGAEKVAFIAKETEAWLANPSCPPST
jgi:hypothetical protein